MGGLANYQKLLKDNVFHTAIWNSTKYMLFTLVLLIPFPMLFAVLMDSRLVKAKGVWKAILYMPALTSVVISGTLFRLMFTEYSTGQMNIITAALGLGTYKWLKMGWSGMTALLVVACWRWTGVNMLYFLSGLKAIDSSLYEASEIDGASAWQKFRYVTLPLLKPTTVYVLTISIYAGLAMFLESYMLWAGNNSPNNIGLTIVGYLYKRESRNEARCAVGGSSRIALAINIVQLIAMEHLRMRRNNMADEKNRKGDMGLKSGKTKRTVGTVLGTGFFAVLSMIIFPVFAGLLASFRPGTELIRRDCRSISISVR